MLKRDQYFKTVRRPYPPLFGSFFMHGYSNEEILRPFVSKKFRMNDLIISDGVWYYPVDDTKVAQRLCFKWWCNSKRLSVIKKLLKQREQGLIKAASKDFDSYSAAYEVYMPALLFIWALEEPVTTKIRDLLSKKLSKIELEKLMSELNIPLDDNFYKLEEYELVTSKNLSAHIKKYEWIHSRYGEIKPYTIKEARQKLTKIDKQQFLRDWKHQKVQVKKSIAYAKRLIPAKDRVIVDLMQFIIYYRTQRTDILNRSHYLHASKLIKLAAEKKISYQELLHCTKDEVLNKIPPRKVLRDRIKDYAVVLEKGENIYCASGRASDKIRKILAEKTEKMNEVRGNIAYIGNVKGKTKLIISTKDFSKVQSGDIIVTSMTNPHMVPIMKKAGGFVTDEGGITCHAAIMAREMKKPCVIGTKIATKIFKDGDIVEVDANKGIVRKLK